VTNQASLLVQPGVQFRTGYSLQQTNHRSDNSTLLDEVDLPLKNRR